MDNFALANEEFLHHAQRVVRYDIHFPVGSNAVTYKQLILNRNPHIYWKCENGTASANLGAIGSAGNATYVGNVTFEQGRPDTSDTAAVLNGTTAFLQGTATRITPIGPSIRYSLEAWVRVNALPTGLALIAGCSGAGGPTMFDIGLVARSDGAILLLTPTRTLEALNAIQVGEWMHVAGVVDGITWSIYVNGQLAASVTTADLVPTTANKFFSAGIPRTTTGTPHTGAPWGYLNAALDEIAFYPNGVLTSFDIHQRWMTGFHRAVFEPHLDVDTAPPEYTSRGFAYRDLVNHLGPIHWWRLDETATHIYADSVGTVPMTYLPGVFTNQDVSPLHGAVGSSKVFDGRTGVTPLRVAQSAASLNVNPATTPRTAFSMSCWFRTSIWWSSGPGGATTTPRVLFRWTHNNDRGGFRVWMTAQGFVELEVFGSQTVGTVISRVRIPVRVVSGRWMHLAFTVSWNGRVRAFLNGEFVGEIAYTPDFRGIHVPSTAARVDFGVDTGSDSLNQDFSLDEVMCFAKELSPQDIAGLFQTAKHGVNYSIRTIRQDGTDQGLISTPQNKYAILWNAVDITDLVDSIDIGQDLKETATKASLTLRDDWKDSLAPELLSANTYVVIEEKYIADDREQDTGWRPLGHFLVDGVVQQSWNEDGKQNTVVMRDPGKLLSLDYFRENVEPDKMFVAKAPLNFVALDGDRYIFRKLRPGYESSTDDELKYFQNWAEAPSLRMWAKDLTKFIQQGDDRWETLRFSDAKPGDEIRIKSGQGAVQVVGGMGAVVIDKDFYEDAVANFGLGFPNVNTGVLAEFHRYAGHPDVERGATITAITFSVSKNRHLLHLSGVTSPGAAQGKTVFMTSGQAKGQRFSLMSVDDEAEWGFRGFAVAQSLHTPGAIPWVNPTNALVENEVGATCQCATIFASTNEASLHGSSEFLRVTGADMTLPIPDAAIIRGVEVEAVHSSRSAIVRWAHGPKNQNHHIAEWAPGSVQLVVGGTTQGQNKGNTVPWTQLQVQRQSGQTQRTLEDGWSSTRFGGSTDTWGLNLTGAQVKAAGFGVQIRLIQRLSNIPNGVSVNMRTSVPNLYGRVDVDAIRVKLHYDGGVATFVLRDPQGRTVNPLAYDIAVNDGIQIGDSNRLEDAIRKVMLACKFQESNSTQPFYFRVEDCGYDILVPPLRFNTESTTHAAEVLTQIMEYAPPHYAMVNNSNGVITFRTITTTQDPHHDLSNSTIEESVDATDVMAYTRVVAAGISASAVNAAIAAGHGGVAAVRAYKLNDFVVDGANINGVTRTQAQANAIVSRVLDASAKTPAPTGVGAATDGVTAFGLIWQQAGRSVNRWAMEDTDLFCIDLGHNPGAGVVRAEFEISDIEFTFLNTFIDGNILAQSVFVYYMTADDYFAEYGMPAPDVPSQALADQDISYMPRAGARNWKLLVDEMNLEDGKNSVNSQDFETQRPTRMRFLKIVVGQPQFRFEVPDKYDGRKFSRICLNGFKAWTSNRILASASLGATAPYDSGAHKELAHRLQRRTFWLDENPYLDSYDKAKEFALRELQERFTEFKPLAISGFMPFVQAGDVIAYRAQKDVHTRNYIVKSIQQVREAPSGVRSSAVLANFDIEL